MCNHGWWHCPRFLLGPLMGDYQPIHRDPNKTHYYTPYEEVPAAEKTFPMYISGNLRISNPGTARAIAEAAKVVRFVRMEDVWVTGYIAKYLHIQHQVMSLLYFNIFVFHKLNLISSFRNVLWSGVVLLKKQWSYIYKRQCRTQEWLSRIIWFHLSHLRLSLVFWESVISHLFTWHFISGLSNIFNFSNIMPIMLKYLIYLLLFCNCRWCYLNKCKNNIYDAWSNMKFIISLKMLSNCVVWISGRKNCFEPCIDVSFTLAEQFNVTF